MAMVIWSAGQNELGPTLTGLLFRALSAPMMGRLQGFTPQDCVMVCNGMARSGWRDPVLMKRMAAAMMQSPAWTKREVVMGVGTVAWSFATLRLRHAGLLRALADHCSKHLGDMKDWNLCAVAWAYRELLGEDGELASFLALVDAELLRRGIPRERVQLSREGFQEWLQV